MRQTTLLAFICILFGMAASQSAIATIQNGFGTVTGNYYPLDTFFSDSRYQFVIPVTELNMADNGQVEAIALRKNDSQIASNNSLTIRMSSVTATTADSIAQGYFVNGDLHECSSFALNVSGNAGAWAYLPFQNYFYPNDNRPFILVDLVLDDTEGDVTTTWQVVPSDFPAIRRGQTSADPSFNFLNRETGFTLNSRPVIKLIGPVRDVPAHIVDGEQLADDNGQIFADCVANEDCTIHPGVMLDFAEGFGIRFNGSLTANGTPADSVRFIGDGWAGILADMDSTEQMLMDHVVVENVDNYYYSALYLSSDESVDPVRHRITDAVFRNCSGGFQTSSIQADYATLDLKRVSFLDNDQTSLYMYNCHGILKDLVVKGIDGFYGLRLRQGMDNPEDALSGLLIAENTSSNSLITLVNAPLSLDHISCLNNFCSNGLYTSTGQHILHHSIFDNPDANREITTWDGSLVVADYSLIRGGIESTNGNVLLGMNTLDLDPMLDTQYRPLAGAPVIDAGNPEAQSDPDLTIADIGYHWFDQSAPSLLAVTDVPEDQGRRLQAYWMPSSMDLAQADNSWFYSIWRLDSLFNTRSQPEQPVIHDKHELERALAEGRPFTWMRDGQAWNWLVTVPASQHADYAQVVETLADRMNGQDLQTPIKVMWHAGELLSESDVLSAASVDNVAPDAPLGLMASNQPDGQLGLSWQEVSTGTINGVLLEERGPVSYRVYEGSTPWFDLQDGTDLGLVMQPELMLPMPDPDSIGFYRVVAEDIAD